MTREHWQSLLPIITAFAEGKKIIYAGVAPGELNFLSPVSAYTIQEFTLPEPPKGKEWHNSNGWTDDDLPEGFRPLLLGEMPHEGDEVKMYGETWRKQDEGQLTIEANAGGAPQRTKRPLPVEPHNPQNLTPEEVGEGWRLRALGEVIGEGDEYWYDLESEWRTTNYEGIKHNFKGSAYRTRTEPSRADLKKQLAEIKAQLATLEAKLHV